MMENKFTPRAEESLRLAQEAAEEMGHGYVGSEHLLLGLMREEEGIAHRVLEEAGLTDDMICDVLHRSVGTGLSGAAPSQGLTPRAKSAVELAVSEASRTGFKTCIIPRHGTGNVTAPDGMELLRVRNIREAIELALA